jgi:predicted transcriptional regulator
VASSTTSLKLAPEMKQRVERLAEAKDRSAHWVMKRAVEEFVDREEKQMLFLRDALDSWENYQRTGLHATAEEVDDWLEKLARGEIVPPPKTHT